MENDVIAISVQDQRALPAAYHKYVSSPDLLQTLLACLSFIKGISIYGD